MPNYVKIIGALFLYFCATTIYFYGEALFLRDWAAGLYHQACGWLAIKIVTIPMYAIGTYWLFSYAKTWSIAEFPYWIMSFVISYVAYVQVLDVKITWREIVGALMILGAMALVGSKK